MRISSIYVLSPVYNRESTLEPFLFSGDASITPIEKIAEFCKHKGIQFHIFLVNDGSTDDTARILKKFESSPLVIQYLNKEKNEGLARALLDGYKEIISFSPFIERGNTLSVRLDSDLEHNPKHILQLADTVIEGFDGALHQLKYRKEDQTDLDYWFDGSQGVFQGNVILGGGESLLHNCPGYSAYRIDVLMKMLPLYEKYLELYKQEYGIEPTWGGDMALLFIAQFLGFRIATHLSAELTRSSPNRTIDKVLQQIDRNTKHLMLFRKIQTGKVKL